ncbi:MAG: beta-lactamase family protein [Chloroflexi bacterium]|nr:beta-lactamase family protein [Chloroflexota bacterium]
MTALEQRTVDDVVEDAMREAHVPGVAVGILHDGAEETHAFGVTSVENPLPVTADTLFQIGSITKTFTATLLMQLVSRGRIDLDAPVRSVLPDFSLQDQAAAATLTPRHLLTHTGGFVGDDFTDTGTGDDALARYVANMATLPQLAPLGELFSYCNSGFAVAGRMIEVRTGTTYERAAQTALLDPLEMTHSFLEPADVMTHRFAVGHFSPFSDTEEVGVLRPWRLARATAPVGGLASTVTDMLRYARLHLGLLGDDILDPPSREMMQSVWAPAGNFAEAVGGAWMLRGPAERRVVSHGGSTLGQQAALHLVPSRGVAAVVLTNGSRGALVAERIVHWALEHYAGISEPDPTTHPLGSAELDQYVGRYEQPLTSIDLRASQEGGLIIQATPKGGFPTRDSPPPPTPPPARFAFWTEDRILGLDPPYRGARAEFLRGPDGSLKWLRIGGRLSARQ